MNGNELFYEERITQLGALNRLNLPYVQ